MWKIWVKQREHLTCSITYITCDICVTPWKLQPMCDMKVTFQTKEFWRRLSFTDIMENDNMSYEASHLLRWACNKETKITMNSSVQIRFKKKKNRKTLHKSINNINPSLKMISRTVNVNISRHYNSSVYFQSNKKEAFRTLRSGFSCVQRA